MEIGIVGLGKMGANMCIRLMQGGHSVVAFARTASKVHAVVGHGARGLESLAQMAPTLSAPRAAWVMVPAGEATESVITELAASFDEGDIIIDGGAYRGEGGRGRDPGLERRAGTGGWQGVPVQRPWRRGAAGVRRPGAGVRGAVAGRVSSRRTQTRI